MVKVLEFAHTLKFVFLVL